MAGGGRFLLPLLVGAVSVAAFLPALDADFVHWDDDVNIVGNPHFRGLGWPQLRWMLTTTLLGHWIPLTWLTFGINYVLGGMDPWGYHLGNLLLHGANVALFFLAARRLLVAGFSPGPAAPPAATPMAFTLGALVAALIFGVHPLRVESVAWVTERRDVLSGLFYLLAVFAYLRGAEPGGAFRGRWLTASLAAFAAALASKAMAMTLPVTLLLLDAYPLRRWRGLGWRALLAEKVPYVGLTAATALVAVFALSRGSPWTAYEAYPAPQRVAMVGYSLWFYPAKLVWPFPLSPLYELPTRIDPFSLRFLGPIGAVVAVTVLLVALAPRWPAGLAAWLHSAVVLAPVSGIIHAGHQLAHDRYSYLSGLGFAVLAGAAVTWTLWAAPRGQVARWVPAAVLGVAAVAIVGWGAGTWRQIAVWHDSEALWRAAVDADDTCAICISNLGNVLMEGIPERDARLADVEVHFRRALALRPDYADAHRSLGALLVKQGRYADAEALFVEMMGRFPHLADGATRLASLYGVQGRHDDAIALLRERLRTGSPSAGVRPELGRALNNRGIEHATHGQLAEARAAFEEASRLLPEDVQPLQNLGRLLVEQGQGATAQITLQRAVALNPGNAAARFWLVRAYLLSGDRRRAEAEVAALRGLDAALAERALAR